MNATVVLVAITIGLSLSAVAAVRHARRNPRIDTIDEMRRLAAAEGWSFIEPAGGDRVFVVAHDDWELVGLFFRGGNRAVVASNHHTQWSAPYSGPDAVMLGPKLPRAVARLDLGDSRVQSVLRPLLGDRVALLAGAQRMTEVGDDQFNRYFDVIATDRTAAERIVGDGARWTRLREQLPAPPVAFIGNGEVTILMRRKLLTRQQARAIVEVGSALLR